MRSRNTSAYLFVLVLVVVAAGAWAMAGSAAANGGQADGSALRHVAALAVQFLPVIVMVLFLVIRVRGGRRRA